MSILIYENDQLLNSIFHYQIGNYENCNLSICNDSSFSHLSSALGIKTIVLMADTPLIYGNYSSKMYPILPDGENSVSHNTLGKEKINSHKIFLKFKELIN